MLQLLRLPLLLLSVLTLSGCVEEHRSLEGKRASVYDFANGCFALAAKDPGDPVPLLLSASDSTYAFARQPLASATPFFLKPSGLGHYLFFDDGGSYLVSDGSDLLRESELLSDVLLVDDEFQSEAEWELRAARRHRGRFVLRHLLSGRFLTTRGLVDRETDAAAVALLERKGCAEFPEATVDAVGTPKRVRFEDGSLFGFAETHSHLLSNFGFGGAGIYHGAPFHPLGIEHALPDCEIFHGVDGRKDLFGFGFDAGPDLDSNVLLIGLLTGQTPTPNHVTAGYPDFVDWPSAFASSTHQVMYYKWLERAYLGGLRLLVQHATSNQVICDFLAGGGIQPIRYSCNDMVAVDRIIEETYNMEAYIDAQEGGPGEGWFRIVTSPAEARRVIGAGKLAVVLGIETSALFDCVLTPTEDSPRCDEQWVVDQLDEYRARGVRAIFPVHKYDNAFSAGDGQKGIIEVGNVIHTSHFSNLVEDCDESTNTVFDKGPINFPGLNEPRDDYFAEPPNDFSGFADNPVSTLLPFLGRFLVPPGRVESCQGAGLTPLGEFLIEQMMRRGMIIELDHLPRQSYARAFEILEANRYPAAGTHGLNNDGRLYALGGVSKSGFGRCRAEGRTGTVDDGYQARIRLIAENGGFPAEGFGLDLNGFAGAPGPRFGPDSVCGDTQQDPLSYPFESYAGDVTFYEPQLGNRAVDFNTEGLVHVGMLPELIEEVRRDGVSDEDLAPLFKSAEGYVRMWERAERRAQALRGKHHPRRFRGHLRWLFSHWRP